MNILIIGFGRFGQLLAQILSKDFSVYVWNRSDKDIQIKEAGAQSISLEDGIKKCHVIFYAVPISNLERVVRDHSKLLAKYDTKLVVDVLSVKVLAKNIFDTYLPKNCRALLSHPVFGPESVKAKGLQGHVMMIDPYTATKDECRFWEQYWMKKGLEVINISAEKHDEYAANSQGVVFFLSRVLKDFGFKPTVIDTHWAKQQYSIVENLNLDTGQLFVDLQTWNPFTSEMRLRLGRSLEKIDQELLPERVDTDHLVFGIQGGKGSFNEVALHQYVADQSIKDYRVKYLYTSNKVLSALHKGDIDYGIFAVHNSVGGAVHESMHAMANYRFKITQEVVIHIKHSLMKHKYVTFDEVTRIMTHPQVIKQCASNLEKYSYLTIESGEGDLIDHAEVARLLAQGELPKEIAVMGPEILADLYDLDVVEKDLQVSENNLTTFFVVERKRDLG